MRAFHNTEVTKPQLLASLEAHAAADRFVKGRYWDEGKGCAVGCSLRDFRPGEEDEHALYEPLFGVPRALARLEDPIFERLTVEESKAWPLRFARAIPEGADLSTVWARFTLRVLADPEHGTILRCDAKGKAATETVVALLRRVAAGDTPTRDEWRSAAAAAYAAADAAAYAAAAADAYAAERRRRRTEASEAARQAAWTRMAGWLIAEMEASPHG